MPSPSFPAIGTTLLIPIEYLPIRRAVAANTTVNAATLEGIVASTNISGGAASGKRYSGGLENFLRLLETWGNGSTTFDLQRFHRRPVSQPVRDELLAGSPATIMTNPCAIGALIRTSRTAPKYRPARRRPKPSSAATGTQPASNGHPPRAGNRRRGKEVSGVCVHASAVSIQ